MIFYGCQSMTDVSTCSAYPSNNFSRMDKNWFQNRVFGKAVAIESATCLKTLSYHLLHSPQRFLFLSAPSWIQVWTCDTVLKSQYYYHCHHRPCYEQIFWSLFFLVRFLRPYSHRSKVAPTHHQHVPLAVENCHDP